MMIELPFWADILILIGLWAIIIAIAVKSESLGSIFALFLMTIWLLVFMLDCEGTTGLPSTDDARYRIGSWYTNEYSVTEGSIVLHGYYYRMTDGNYIHTDDEMVILGDSYRIHDRD